MNTTIRSILAVIALALVAAFLVVNANAATPAPDSTRAHASTVTTNVAPPPPPPLPAPPPFMANAVTVELNQQLAIAELDEGLFGTPSAAQYFAGEVEAIQVSIGIVGDYGIDDYSLQLLNEEQLYYIQLYGFTGPNGAIRQGVSAGFGDALTDLIYDGVYGLD